MRTALLTALLAAPLLAAPSAPAFAQSARPQSGEGQEITVTGRRIQDYRARLAACLARRCPPNEDVDATPGARRGRVPEPAIMQERAGRSCLARPQPATCARLSRAGRRPLPRPCPGLPPSRLAATSAALDPRYPARAPGSGHPDRGLSPFHRAARDRRGLYVRQPAGRGAASELARAGQGRPRRRPAPTSPASPSCAASGSTICSPPTARPARGCSR